MVVYCVLIKIVFRCILIFFGRNTYLFALHNLAGTSKIFALIWFIWWLYKEDHKLLSKEILNKLDIYFRYPVLTLLIMNHFRRVYKFDGTSRLSYCHKIWRIVYKSKLVYLIFLC